MTDLYDAEYCNECRGLGDDFAYDYEGELICRCDDCPFRYKGDEE